VALWRAEDARREEAFRQRLAEVEQERDHLQQQLDARPVRVVTENLDKQTVDEALLKRDAAYRSRDSAFRALCEVRLLHREREPGMCRCGRRLDRCEIAIIVDRYPALRSWEKQQVDRFRRHEVHSLPDNHPAIIDPRWQPDADDFRWQPDADED
jgi:hypothetical protein